jgi:hypothetical protein
MVSTAFFLSWSTAMAFALRRFLSAIARAYRAFPNMDWGIDYGAACST